MQFRQNPNPVNPKLKIISLGGFGEVNSNMFLYETDTDILIVDCGIGFPNEEMLGVDLLIPDITYLKTRVSKIRGLVITHGHEDHIGALPYILPQLPDIPVYASRLPANLIMEKLAEYENMPKTVNILEPGTPVRLGQFTVESVRISHSIPDSTNLIIQTPVGTIYHGSDFKFDFSPVDGVQPQHGRIAAAGNAGVKLLLSDSLGSDHDGYALSEKELEKMFEREVSNCEGRFFVTTIGSNISRFRQAAEAAVRHGRRIALVGRSIQRNISVASRLGYIKIPAAALVQPKEIRRIPPKNLCVLVAGSQGQTGSSLERIARGDHHDVSIEPKDKVLFSSDRIPGTDATLENVINSLSKLGATVVHSGTAGGVHVSGHALRQDMRLMIALTRPQYLLPIGGEYYQMVEYSLLAQTMGYPAGKILLPQHNQTIEVSESGVTLGEKIDIKNIMVDGLGIGDVGEAVLRDRQHLAEEGIVVAVAEIDQNDFSHLINIELINRGFVFDKYYSHLLEEATTQVKNAFTKKSGHIDSDRYARQIIIDVLEHFFFDRTHRRPMILPVVVEV